MSLNEFKKVFDDSDIIETSRQKLKILKHSKAATNYATEFTRLAAPANGTLCLALFFWRAGGILSVQGNSRAF